MVASRAGREHDRGLYASYGEGSAHIRDLRSRWHVVESRELDAPAERVERVLADALFTATGTRVLEREGAPHVELRRPRSVFDLCEVDATVTPLDEARSRVEATIAFDLSDGRIDLVIMLTSSVFGIPVSLAWRAASIRGARAYARATLDALWKALADLTASAAYR